MPSLVQSLFAVHLCRFAFKCNTHQHPKTIQSFSLPQNFIRKSEPAVEHKNHPASNANPKVKCPKNHRLKPSFKGRSHGKFSVDLSLCSRLNPELQAPLSLPNAWLNQVQKSRFDNMRRLSNYRLLNNVSVCCLLVVYPFSPVSSLTTSV